MKTRIALAMTAMIAILVLAACAPAPAPFISLEGTGWQLTTLGGQPPLAGTVVTLNFDGGKASGSDGCNRYSTSFNSSSDGKLTVAKDVISTKMACAGPVMQQGMAYIAALTGASAYQSYGKVLTLLDAGGKTLATFSPQSLDLGGTSWTVTAINNGKGAVGSPVAGTKLTVAFSADGKVTGSAGCNGYGGKYQSTGKSIKIGEIVSTLMACPSPAGVMEQESRFLKTLPTAATIRLDCNSLDLLSADGATAISLQRAAKP